MVEKPKPLSCYTGETIAVIVTLLGCFGLYYGCAMLLVPVFPRQPDFARTITLVILLPISFSIVCFLLGGWVWSRTTKVVFAKALAYVVGISIGMVFLVFIILAVGSNFRH